MSSGVSEWASEQTKEHSGVRERSEQCGASEWVSGVIRTYKSFSHVQYLVWSFISSWYAKWHDGGFFNRQQMSGAVRASKQVDERMVQSLTRWFLSHSTQCASDWTRGCCFSYGSQSRVSSASSYLGQIRFCFKLPKLPFSVTRKKKASAEAVAAKTTTK